MSDLFYVDFDEREAVDTPEVDEEVVSASGRTRAERRKLGFHKALRRRVIDTFLAKRARTKSPSFPQLHQYTKNKQHYSTVIDAGKRNNRAGHGQAVTPSISDIRRSNALDSSLREDYLYGEAG